jgi:hypothetical protein
MEGAPEAVDVDIGKLASLSFRPSFSMFCEVMMAAL